MPQSIKKRDEKISHLVERSSWAQARHKKPIQSTSDRDIRNMRILGQQSD